MRTLLYILLMGGLPFLISCQPQGPDLNDPMAMADYLCQRTRDIIDAAQKGDKLREDEILTEMETLEEQMKALHQDDFDDFEAELGKCLKSNCKVAAPNFE